MSKVNDGLAHYDTVLMEYLQMGVSNAVVLGELPQCRTHITERMAAQNSAQMVRSLVVTFAGQKSTHSVGRPRDLWETLKFYLAPAWFTRRYPVRFHMETVDAWRLWQSCPKMPERWGQEYRIVIPRPTSSRYPGDNE